MLKFCTSHDHTSWRLEPESVHDMIAFQGVRLCQTKKNITEDVWPNTEELCFGICGKMTSEGISAKNLSNAGGYNVNLQLNQFRLRDAARLFWFKSIHSAYIHVKELWAMVSGYCLPYVYRFVES